MVRKGFAWVVILIVVVAIIIIGGMLWYGVSNSHNPPAISTTKNQSEATPASNLTPQTEQINATRGGTLTLGDGSSVTIPPGMLKQDETITLLLVSKLSDAIPNKGIAQVGNGLMLRFSTPAQFSGGSIPATTTSGIKFVINTSDNTNNVEDSIPASWITDGLGNNVLLGAFGSYSTSTSEATIYVGADVLSAVSSTREIDVGMTNFSF